MSSGSCIWHAALGVYTHKRTSEADSRSCSLLLVSFWPSWQIAILKPWEFSIRNTKHHGKFAFSMRNSDVTIAYRRGQHLSGGILSCSTGESFYAYKVTHAYHNPRLIIENQLGGHRSPLQPRFTPPFHFTCTSPIPTTRECGVNVIHRCDGRPALDVSNSMELLNIAESVILAGNREEEAHRLSENAMLPVFAHRDSQRRPNSVLGGARRH